MIWFRQKAEIFPRAPDWRAFGRTLTGAGIVLLLGACTGLPAQNPSDLHLRPEPAAARAAASTIPAPVQAAPNLPPPRAAAKTDTYSVSVRGIPAQELLFALARDARLNIDLHPGISGMVTINAIDQSLPQILSRIAKQVDMRWEIDGPNLVVMPDTPFLRTYSVDYVNLSREAQVKTEVSSQVGSAGAKGGSSGMTRIESSTRNRFWETLEANIKDILRETDKLIPQSATETESEGSHKAAAAAQQDASPAAAAPKGGAEVSQSTLSQQQTTTRQTRTLFREAAAVIANPESGVLAVRATSRQHEKVQEFLDKVGAASQRQVMIEATIVEVELSDGYQQGINWGCLIASGNTLDTANNCRANIEPATGTSNATETPFGIHYRRLTDRLNLDLTLNLLQQFGNAKVLSSPKVSVLNNQTAVLNVSENVVYFEVSASVAAGNSGAAQKAVNTVPKTVSVGLMMQVTPQISGSGAITLSVRPSITSVSRIVEDPNPNLAEVGTKNLVPQTKTREIESLLRVADGEVTVLGGLMKEEASYDTGQIPGIGHVPVIGEFFKRRNNAVRKSELVIFLRPVIVRGRGSEAYREIVKRLPGEDFFTAPNEAVPFLVPPVPSATGGL